MKMRIQKKFRLCAAWLFVVTAQGLAIGAPPMAEIAQGPLFAAGALVSPNLALALSVEYPTTGEAYKQAFSPSETYLGYWDPMGCYDYRYVNDGNGYFVRAADASKTTNAIECSNKWSGNLLNWSASSAIDMMRYALTGGDRIVDTATQTVLQRAVLRPDDYKAGNFPRKSITGNLDKVIPVTKFKGLQANGTVEFGSCYEKLYVGVSGPGGQSCAARADGERYGPQSSASANVAGAYFARVEVCATVQEANQRPELCQRYPNGQFKPAGTIQRYAEKIRVGAFGYLLDSAPSRYGGVLRAPMHHAGPKMVDASFMKVTNPNAEWDAQTGIFAANPFGGEEGRSGAINYLNQFGRTGTPGNYKSADPVGELYYETMRYLQGLQPTPQATQGMTAAMKDGFPVYNNTAFWGQGARKNWDPVVASCQRNYILAIGDQETHRDRSFPGFPIGVARGRSDGDFSRNANPDDFEPDTSRWTALLGAFENREAIAYTHPSGKTGLTTAGNLGPAPWQRGESSRQLSASMMANAETGSVFGSYGMAGLAYWANTQQIRADYPDARIKTYMIDVDQYGDGSSRGARQTDGFTNMRGSQMYLAAKYGGFDDSNSDGNPFKSSDGSYLSEWADGVDDDGNPKPANFFLASTPSRMIAAIQRIFREASNSSGTVMGGATSGSRVASPVSVYVPEFDPERWSGSLLAYALMLDPVSKEIVQASDPSWNAGMLLTTGSSTAVAGSKPPPQAARKIFTLLGNGSAVPFLWTSLDDSAKRLLNAAPYASPPEQDARGQERLNYLRGDRSAEADVAGTAKPLRRRSSIMGDILNSAPVFVGAPGGNHSGADYANFVNARKNRKHAVYVGANDGMLHAFDAQTGTELFAYVPRMVFPALAAYTSPSYEHRPYVDAPPVAEEAKVGSAWKTVLVSGVGGGGRGVFALDVTDPSAFDADRVMWEFSGTDDTDMGYVTQAPKILSFKTRAAEGSNAAVYRSFAVVPSGYNNGNSTRRAALFLLALDKPTSQAWQLGTNYYKILLSDPVDGMVNALSTPSEYATNDGTVRFMYGGDTQGNLWKFDFTQNAPWSDANALAFEKKPLFVAQDDSGRRQPITVAPQVALGAGGGAVVLFGTGKYLEADDARAASYVPQSIYGVFDNGTRITNGRASLMARAAAPGEDKSKLTVTGSPFAYGPYDASKPESTPRRGWYFDLADATSRGERQVTAMHLVDGRLIFNTLMPNPNVCGAGGGGRTCLVNAATGLTEGKSCNISSIGILSSPIVLQEGYGTFTSTNSFGARTESKRLRTLNLGTGSGDGKAAQKIEDLGKISALAALISWRQVPNYKDVKTRLDGAKAQPGKGGAAP